MLNVICFSKDRPLQLHGCLRSWFINVHDPQSMNLHVLVYMQPPYEDAYTQVMAEFPKVKFHVQTDFSKDLLELIGDSEFVCFCCDDVVMIRPVNLSEAMNFLRNNNSLGLSLRLGRNIQQGFFPYPMQQPQFQSDDRFITWDMTGADQDWCYPWDVLGTIYRRQFVQDMWPSVAQAHNPSEFEAIGALSWTQITEQRHYSAWFTARTVVPTVNVVQNVFANGWIGPVGVSAEFLLQCWQHGLRLDVNRYLHQSYSTWRIGDLVLKRIC